MMLRATDAYPLNFDFLGKGNASKPEGLREQGLIKNRSTIAGQRPANSKHGAQPRCLRIPGDFAERKTRRLPSYHNFRKRTFTVGIGGPVGTGKTALLKALCERMRQEYQLGVVTNDIFTREDAEFLIRHSALDENRIVGV